MVRNYVPRKLKPRRPFRVSTWVSDPEKAKIEEAAAIAGETVAQFMRNVALGAADREIVDELERLRGESA